MANQANKKEQKKEVVLLYAELIAQSPEEIKSEKLQLEVQKSKSQLEVSIATTKYDLALAKEKLKSSMRATPYDVQNELCYSQEVTALEEGLAFAENILSTRF